MEITKEVTATLPLEEGEFQLSLYSNSEDEKEHLSLTMGEVHGGEEILVRVHSECFTGDTFGSQRCDCNAQLHLALEEISRAGRGILIYLRQEGRGIGLRNKLYTYTLQDRGYDTVDANLLLGREADERSYDIAGEILRKLGVKSVRLMTNNPGKIEGLQASGVNVTERVPIQSEPTHQNFDYLKTKMERMQHLLELDGEPQGPSAAHDYVTSDVESKIQNLLDNPDRTHPVTTLSFAQSLDGSIALHPGEPYEISDRPSLTLSHALRALHDAILIGIGTVLADDPQLTVRLEDGSNPRPIIVDSNLRTPADSRFLASPKLRPIIATTQPADHRRADTLRSTGATILTLPADENGLVELQTLLETVWDQEGITTVMVEGGAGIITSFLDQQLAEFLVLTIAPMILGGFRGVGKFGTDEAVHLPDISAQRYQQIGRDMILWGQLDWKQP